MKMIGQPSLASEQLEPMRAGARHHQTGVDKGADVDEPVKRETAVGEHQITLSLKWIISQSHKERIITGGRFVT